MISAYQQDHNLFTDGSGVKNLPARLETRVQSLGGEDPLEEEMTTHPSILAWRIPWTVESAGLTVHGVTKNRTQLSN